MTTFVNKGRLISSVTNSQTGWETTETLTDGSVFFFKWVITSSTNVLGLGRGLGPGAYFQYPQFFKIAFLLTSTTTVAVYVDGSLISTVTIAAINSLNDWWCITRSGSTVTLSHLDNFVVSVTVGSDYKVGNQGFGTGARQIVDVDWSVVGIGNGVASSVSVSITENSIQYEISDGSGSKPAHPMYQQVIG